MRNSFACFAGLAAAAVVGAWSPVALTAAAELRVATFRCDLTPPLGHPAYPKYKPLEKIEHPLLAKGIVLDDGGQRYVLCAIDWCALCNSTYDLFCQKAAEGAGTSLARVAVHTIHQHTAPVADADAIKLLQQTKDPPPCDNPKFFAAMADRLGAAVKESLGRLQPFDRIGTGEGKVDRVASTRRVIEKDGKVHRPRWSVVKGKDIDLRDAPEGLIDPMLKTITLAQGDKPLVRLHYYATHPQSYYGDPRVTYDFPGIARETLEKKENVFQVYFTGCAGDILTGKYNDGTPATREKFVERMLAGMEASIAATRFVPADAIQGRSTEVKLPLYTGPERSLAENRARMANPKEDPGAQTGTRGHAGCLRRANRSAAPVEQLADRPRPHPRLAGRMPGRFSVVRATFGAGRFRGGGLVRRPGTRLHLHRQGVRGRRLRADRHGRRARLGAPDKGRDPQASRREVRDRAGQVAEVGGLRRAIRLDF